MSKCPICNYEGNEQRTLYHCGNENVSGTVCEGAYQKLLEYRVKTRQIADLLKKYSAGEITKDQINELIKILESIE